MLKLDFQCGSPKCEKVCVKLANQNFYCKKSELQVFHRNSQLVFLQLVSVEIGVALYEAKHNIILLQIIIVLFVTKIHNLDFWMNFKSEKCFIEIHKSDFQCRNPSCEFITAT